MRKSSATSSALVLEKKGKRELGDDVNKDFLSFVSYHVEEQLVFEVTLIMCWYFFVLCRHAWNV